MKMAALLIRMSIFPNALTAAARGFGCLGFVDVGDDDRRPFAGEALAGRLPNSIRPAGDDRHLSLKSIHEAVLDTKEDQADIFASGDVRTILPRPPAGRNGAARRVPN
jgi:hypothetical protein